MKIIKNIFKAYSYIVGSLSLISIIVSVLDKHYFVEDISNVQEMEDKENEKNV